MKKFIILSCFLIILTISCRNMQNEKFLSLYSTTAVDNIQTMDDVHYYKLFSANKNTTDIDVHILKNESRWINIYSMHTNCDYISIAFYPKDAVISKGKIRKDWKGNPRFYYIFLPKWEKLLSCNENGIKLCRRNGEIHEIKFNIIDN